MQTLFPFYLWSVLNELTPYAPEQRVMIVALKHLVVSKFKKNQFDEHPDFDLPTVGKNCSFETGCFCQSF